MSNNPLVYVLTLNWNGKQITIDCVKSILKSDYPNYKIVVVDNGSTDGSITALRKEFNNKITIIENGKNLGYSRGMNVGLKYGFEKDNADYCLVMNNDIIIDKSAITELVKVAETDKKIGFVIGKVYYFDKPNILQTVGKKYDPIRWNGGHIGNREEDRGQYDKIEERPFADDIFALISGKMYKETDGYNPVFFLQSEEYDWQARAKKLGYKIMYTPYAKIWHKDSMTIGKTSPLKAFYDARNPMIVILKHKPPSFFKRYFWLHFRNDIFKSSLKLIIKKFEFKKAYKIWAGFFSALHWGLKNKKFTLRHFI